MKHAPFIQNRKTGQPRKYPSQLGRKIKTAIKQKTENKEAKKKEKNWYKKTKQIATLPAAEK